MSSAKLNGVDCHCWRALRASRWRAVPGEYRRARRQLSQSPVFPLLAPVQPRHSTPFRTTPGGREIGPLIPFHKDAIHAVVVRPGSTGTSPKSASG